MEYTLRFLIHNLFSNAFDSCSFTNPEFLNPHSVSFDCMTNLRFFFFKYLSLNFQYFFYTLHNKCLCYFTTSVTKKHKLINKKINLKFIF